MHADQLRMAVTKVVALLQEAQIASVVDQYRAAKGEQRTVSSERLRQSAAFLMERFDGMSPAERQVTKILHLESLGSPNYWLELFSSVSEVKKHQGEIVRLASRIMFARSHLPGLISLVSVVKPEAVPAAAAPSAQQTQVLPQLEQGEAHLYIRLTDAGERASDPDRVARSIDGIDMLYSACASVARKPAIDLRLDTVLSKRNRDRDLVFTGERDSIAAVYAVIDSIPAVLAELDPEQEIDLDAVVRSLPIFGDLHTLALLGTFSKQDLKDISDTMHQGALLTLESGVIPVDPEDAVGGKTKPEASPAPPANNQASVRTAPVSRQPLVEKDEHYERYLKEREAMLRSQAAASASAPHSVAPYHGNQNQVAIDQSRRDAVDDLLKSLGQSRGQ
ncbi:MAG: hypothetical protein AB8B84_04835 [Granulosicoccus sp.]